METFSIVFTILITLVIGILIGLELERVQPPLVRVRRRRAALGRDDEHEENLVWWDFD